MTEMRWDYRAKSFVSTIYTGIHRTATTIKSINNISSAEWTPTVHILFSSLAGIVRYRRHTTSTHTAYTHNYTAQTKSRVYIILECIELKCLRMYAAAHSTSVYSEQKKILHTYVLAKVAYLFIFFFLLLLMSIVYLNSHIYVATLCV